MNYHVVISGGGIAGLTLALKLVQRNIKVAVIEKEISPTIKYKGELLQPKSLEILSHLSIIDEVHKYGHKINTTNINEFGNREDKITFSYNLLEHQYNYALMIPHEKLKDIILQKAQEYESFNYIKPAKLLDFKEVDEIKKEAVIEDQNRELFNLRADFFVGAEGRLSPIRRKLDIDLAETKYNHYFLTVSFPRPSSLTEGEMIVKGHRFLGLFPLAQERVRSVLLVKPEEYKILRKEGLEKIYQYYIDLFPDLDGYVQAIKSWKDIQLMIPMRHNAKQYIKGNCALIGDAVHSVHPMAGEGMNLAIQDADVLGELFGWMYEKKQLDPSNLKWYEYVRKPKVEYLSSLSHQSALAYSYSHPLWRSFRTKVLKNMSETRLLHFKQMLNISGLGIWKETPIDRLIQVNILPKGIFQRKINQNNFFFKKEDIYPWYSQ